MHGDSHITPKTIIANDGMVKIKEGIMAKLAERPADKRPQEPDQTINARIELAEAGILHLLAVRELRRMRYNAVASINPDDPYLQANRSDEDMATGKIVSRLLAARVKAYLLDPDLPRDDTVFVVNPYTQANLSGEEIQRTLADIQAGGKEINPDITQAIAVIKRAQARLTEQGNIKELMKRAMGTLDWEDINLPEHTKLQHCRITDTGIQLTPYWPPVGQRAALDKLRTVAWGNRVHDEPKVPGLGSP